MEIEQEAVKLNWGGGRSTWPAVWVTPESYEQIQRIVQDTADEFLCGFGLGGFEAVESHCDRQARR